MNIKTMDSHPLDLRHTALLKYSPTKACLPRNN